MPSQVTVMKKLQETNPIKAMIVQLIKISERTGDGTIENPVRYVDYYYTMDGEKVATAYDVRPEGV